ncbi:hypothetical protein CLIB1444_01S09164 [[Candida] jaroonii]|uniref:Uncharacterized protein n=1 Tax=[Candida] jaroonii TaxID=467808 RepID=A0ACA9Y0S4_9ASCO|nr:hypothetical protein CLIB1444_01S09164 [[Candida] jaroonii]
MADISPNTKKVNDFLSSLSKMSQDRLSEDHQIGRDLDRDIESLRGNGKRYHYLSDGTPIEYSLSEDQTSRKSPLTLGDESPPKMPRRPIEQPPPSLPRRKYLDDEDGPPLPQRKVSGSKPIKPAKPSFTKANEKDFEVNLVQPVARTSAPIVKKKEIDIAEKYGLKKFTPTTSAALTGHRSFADIESSIRNGNSGKTEEPPSKPPKPAKSWLNSSIQASKPYHETDAPKPNSDIAKLVKSPKKDTAFDINDIHRDKNSNSWIDSVVSKSPQRGIEAKAHQTKPQPIEFTKKTENGNSEIKIKPEVKNKPEIKTKPEIKGKPEIKTKPEIKNSEIKAKSETQKPQIKAKPAITPKTQFNIQKPTYKEQDNELLLAQLSKLKSRKSPPPPVKDFKKLDVEPLKTTLGRLSPTKVMEDKSNLSNYKQADNDLLNRQLNKIKEKPVVKSKPMIDQKSIDKPAIDQKPVIDKPKGGKPKEDKQLRETHTKIPTIRNKPPAIKKSTPEIKPKPTNDSQSSLTSLDFKSQLSSILRSNTEPTTSSPSMQIQRSNTEPEKSQSKLTHPNKSRSKGPKRRLPKSFKNEKQPQPSNIKPKPPIKPKPKSVGDLKSNIDFDVFI